MANYDEDTEWNDILRAKGVIPQKEPEITEADIVDMIDDALAEREAKALQQKTVDELDELLEEGDEEEERVLLEYRFVFIDFLSERCSLVFDVMINRRQLF